MTPEELKNRYFQDEFMFSSSRSSGPGGQNVNKVNTKVELRFNITKTTLFSSEEKELIFTKLKNKINNEGEIILISQSERTQLLNKVAVTAKFYEIFSRALTVPKKRTSTRPTYSSKIKRLSEKRIRGYIKKSRKQSGDSLDE